MTNDSYTRNRRPTVTNQGVRGSEDVPLPYHSLGKPGLLRETSSDRRSNVTGKHNPRKRPRIREAGNSRHRSGKRVRTRAVPRPARELVAAASIMTRIDALNRSRAIALKSVRFASVDHLKHGAVLEGRITEEVVYFRHGKILRPQSTRLGLPIEPLPYPQAVIQEVISLELLLRRLSHSLRSKGKRVDGIRLLGANRLTRGPEHRADVYVESFKPEKQGWRSTDTATVLVILGAAYVLSRVIRV